MQVMVDGKLSKKKTRKRMRPFERLVKRYGAGAAFFAAATPIPDDLVYVPLGLAKYNPTSFLYCNSYWQTSTKLRNCFCLPQSWIVSCRTIS